MEYRFPSQLLDSCCNNLPLYQTKRFEIDNLQLVVQRPPKQSLSQSAETNINNKHFH